MVEVGILKSLWRKNQDGRWGIHDLKGLKLKPRAGFGSDFFPYESQMELMTSLPATSSVHELFTSFGSTDFLMKQSILPVVAWVEGESFIRCIGTAFVISCTGYLITACHVLLDPQDRKYGKVMRGSNAIRFMDGVRMGVLIPINPAFVWVHGQPIFFI
jgi:S1-C subfamily serine protease